MIKIKWCKEHEPLDQSLHSVDVQKAIAIILMRQSLSKCTSEYPNQPDLLRKLGTSAPRISLKTRDSLTFFKVFFLRSFGLAPNVSPIWWTPKESGQKMARSSLGIIPPCSRASSPHLTVGETGSARLSVVHLELKPRSQVPLTPLHLLTCLTTVAFRRFSESQSETLVGQDKPVRGDERRLDAQCRGTGQLDSCYSREGWRTHCKPSRVRQRTRKALLNVERKRVTEHTACGNGNGIHVHSNGDWALTSRRGMGKNWPSRGE